jgi:hypothetical protein
MLIPVLGLSVAPESPPVDGVPVIVNDISGLILVVSFPFGESERVVPVFANLGFTNVKMLLYPLAP